MAVSKERMEYRDMVTVKKKVLRVYWEQELNPDDKEGPI